MGKSPLLLDTSLSSGEGWEDVGFAIRLMGVGLSLRLVIDSDEGESFVLQVRAACSRCGWDAVGDFEYGCPRCPDYSSSKLLRMAFNKKEFTALERNAALYEVTEGAGERVLRTILTDSPHDSILQALVLGELTAFLDGQVQALLGAIRDGGRVNEEVWLRHLNENLDILEQATQELASRVGSP